MSIFETAEWDKIGAWVICLVVVLIVIVGAIINYGRDK